MVDSSDLTRQYMSSLSILAVSLFVGVPIWWKTTEVYRCPLPYKEIGDLQSTHVPPEFSIRVSVALLAEEGGATEGVDLLVKQLSKELVVGSIAARNTRVALRYIIQAHPLGSQQISSLSSYLQSDNPEDFSSHVAELLPSSLGHYFVLLVPNSALPVGDSNQHWKDISVFISQYRHSLVLIRDGKGPSSCLSDVLKVVKSVYTNRVHLEKRLKNAVGITQDRADIESMRQLRASQGYQLSFSLLNPDPSKVRATWNIRDATRDILVPFLEHPGIARLGNFTVSSQEFYYTSTKFSAKTIGTVHYVLPSHIPPMISSVESKLASHVSQYPSLNFLVYVPKQTELPLYIRSDSEGHTLTDNFLVPQWGGMIIHNGKQVSDLDTKGKDPERGRESGGVVQLDIRMEKLMPVFVDQLKMLLGIPDEAIDAQVDGRGFKFSPGSHGVVDWRVDQLLLGKLLESTSMATTSLVSLVQLLDKVKNMVISDRIQREVEYSLQAIKKCYSQSAAGNLSEAYVSAKQAMESAEIAFFDPSILELLYFPDDQKFAIYIPLFLPISVPILFSSMAALKWLAAWLKGGRETVKAS